MTRMQKDLTDLTGSRHALSLYSFMDSMGTDRYADTYTMYICLKVMLCSCSFRNPGQQAPENCYLQIWEEVSNHSNYEHGRST